MIARYLSMIFLCAAVLAIQLADTGKAHAFSQAEVIDGFNKTVFGSEIGGFGFAGNYLRRFEKPVRFYIRSDAGAPASAKRRTQRFVGRLSRLINNLSVEIVSTEAQANFVVHLVARRNYQTTVRDRVYRGRPRLQRQVRNSRCLVRSTFSRAGIRRSAAIIVYDEGARLLRRCITEEILQGLGPLNDNATLKTSIFNDTSRFTGFQRYDRLILNMLYDRRLKSGLSRRRVQPLLPAIYRDVNRTVR
ncbi:MAG: DUF2927 domain-containing protein [Pseudomonadota bacterium]